MICVLFGKKNNLKTKRTKKILHKALKVDFGGYCVVVI